MKFRLRPIDILTAWFAFAAMSFVAGANIALHVNAELSAKRFAFLRDVEDHRGAALRGRRALALGYAEHLTPQQTASFKLEIAQSLDALNRHDSAVIAYNDASTALAEAAPFDSVGQTKIANAIARIQLRQGNRIAGASSFHEFLESAGDAVAAPEIADPLSARHLQNLDEAGALLAETFDKPISQSDIDALDDAPAHAAQLSALGGYFAADARDLAAAQALYATALAVNRSAFGDKHARTHQSMLLLAPVYATLGDLEAAEELYLNLFHTQERLLGANAPALSLYIKLLAGVYQRQERYTEAEALNRHLTGLFADAFGEQRYAANQSGDPIAAIDRPVSSTFAFASEFRPTDLAPAADYGVPLAKDPDWDEMKLRRAAADDAPASATMPGQLAQLLKFCATQSGQELRLRSGFRSFGTQAWLRSHNGDKGTVADAGASEHQSGLAADINVNGRFMRASDPAYLCMEEHAYRFGFILSFPPGNRYLGKSQLMSPGTGVMWAWRQRASTVKSARITNRSNF